MSNLSSHRLVVVGGGVAGLQTARALIRAGFKKVTVLEESDNVGYGTSFKGINHEVPWSAAQMPEFPLSRCSVRPAGPFPTPREMQEYASAYAHAFNLFGCIKLNCKLVNLSPDAQHRWVVSYTNTKERRHYQITASFVVLCTGIHTTPAIPVFPGNEDFRGKVMHSKDLKDVLDLEGKRVVLVGNGRSQSDLQAEVAVAQYAGSVLLLNRKAHWPLPMRMGPISTKRILASRWGTSLVPRPYYTASGFTKAMSAAGQPMKRAVWWALKKSLNKRYKVKKANVIMEEIHKDLHWGGHQSEQNWKTLTQQTKVHSISGRIRLMSPEGLVLDGGQEIACDVIVMCTGYTPNYRFIDPRVNLHLQSGSDGVYLYRHLIHPDVKNLAFVGSMVTSAFYVLTAALQAEWLCRALQQHVKLPTAVDMAHDIAAQRAWRKSFMREGGSAGLLMPYTQKYHDQLMEDMGESKYRKGFNLFAEWFEPYSAADYASLFDPSIKRGSFKVRVQPPSSAAARSSLAAQATSAAGTASGQDHGTVEEQREELRSKHKRQARDERPTVQERRRSVSNPLPQVKRRSVMFAVDPDEGMEDVSHREASRRRLSRSAFDELEHKGEGSGNARTLHSLSRNSANSYMTRELGSGGSNSLFGDLLEGAAHSRGNSEGNLLEHKPSHGQAGTGNTHVPAAASRQSSGRRRFVLGGQHMYSGTIDGCSDMSDLPSGRPSPVGHPSTHGGSAYRADYFVRDSNDTRHTRASSKTIHFSDWDGFSTRHGSMRPSSGRPSTKATDLMHTSESSCRDFWSMSQNTGGQLTGTPHSRHLSNDMNSMGASGSMRASGSMQTSGSQRDSGSRSVSKLMARTPNSIGDGDASVHSGHRESGLLYSPLKHPFRSSMPSVSPIAVVDEDVREGLPPYSSENGLARPGMHLMVGRNSSAPTAMHFLDSSAGHAATSKVNGSTAREQHKRSTSTATGELLLSSHSQATGKHSASTAQATHEHSTSTGELLLSNHSQATGQHSVSTARATQGHSTSTAIAELLPSSRWQAADGEDSADAGGETSDREQGSGALARSSADGMEGLMDVSARDVVCTTGSGGANEAHSDGMMLGRGDSEEDVSVTAWGSTRPYALSSYALSSGPPSSCACMLDVGGHSCAQSSAQALDNPGLNVGHSMVNSAAQVIGNPGLNVVHSDVHRGVHSGVQSSAHLTDVPGGMSASPDLGEGNAGCLEQQFGQQGSVGQLAGMSQNGAFPRHTCPVSIEGEWDAHGRGGHSRGAPSIASAAGSTGMRKEMGCQNGDGASGVEGSVCIVLGGDEQAIHEGGAQCMPPSEHQVSDSCGPQEILRQQQRQQQQLQRQQQQQQQQQQQHESHSEEGMAFWGLDLLRSQEGTHSEDRSARTPSSGQHLFSGSQAEHSGKVLENRCDTFYMLSSRSSPYGPSANPSHATVPSQHLSQLPAHSLQAPDPLKAPPHSHPGRLLQAHSSPNVHHSDALTSQPLSPLPFPHDQFLLSAHTSKPSPCISSNNKDVLDSQGTGSTADKHLYSGKPGHPRPQPSSSPLSHDQPQSIPPPKSHSSPTQFQNPTLSSPSSHEQPQSTPTSPRKTSCPPSPPIEHMSPQEGNAGPCPGNMGSASTSYTHMVSNHMGANGRMGGARGAAGKRRSTLQDAAALELLSAPPPIISASRARSSKLKPTAQDDGHVEASEDLPSPSGKAAALEPRSEDLLVSGSSPPPHHRNICSTSECAEPWSDTGSPRQILHHGEDLSDPDSHQRVQQHRGDLPDKGTSPRAPTSSHIERRQSSAAPFEGALSSQTLPGAEPQLLLSPFQQESLQAKSAGVHHSDHSFVGSTNREDAHERKGLGVIVSGKSMCVTEREPSCTLSQDAPCTSDACFTRHNNFSERLTKRLNAMLPAFLQKSSSAHARGIDDSSAGRHSHSHELPEVEQSASSHLEVVDPQLSEPLVGDKHRNRRKSIALGMLARNRENMHGSSSSFGASPTHPLASFLYRSSEGLNSQGGNFKTLGDFRSSSPSLGGSSPTGSATPTITTAAAAQHVFQGIINEGLGQLIQHYESQQQEARNRQQQVASRAMRVKAARNQRSSLSMVSTRNPEGDLEEVQPRTSSFSNIVKGVQRRLR